MTEEKGKRERNRRDGEKRNNSPKRDNADEGRGDSFIMLPHRGFLFQRADEESESKERVRGGNSWKRARYSPSDYSD